MASLSLGMARHVLSTLSRRPGGTTVGELSRLLGHRPAKGASVVGVMLAELQRWQLVVSEPLQGQ